MSVHRMSLEHRGERGQLCWWKIAEDFAEKRISKVHLEGPRSLPRKGKRGQVGRTTLENTSTEDLVKL